MVPGTSAAFPTPGPSSGDLRPGRWPLGRRFAIALLALVWVGFAWGGGAAQAAPGDRPVVQEPTPTAELSPEFLAAYERLRSRETDPASPEPGAGPSRDTALPALNTWLAALLVVGGLAYGGLWGWRRLRSGGLAGRSPGRWIWVREERSLGAAQRLVLAQVGETSLLLGVTEQQITLLARFDAQALEAQDPEGFAARLDQVLSPEAAVALSFAGTDGPAEPNVHERVEDLRSLRQGPQGRTAFSDFPSEVTGHA